MKIHALTAAPAAAMSVALGEFESRFTYPLGPDRSFRISHGEDYPRFYRSIGSASCFIAEKETRIVGALGVAIRSMLMPDGSERKVAYIGDLKVDPGLRGTLVFLRLAQAALAWARPQVSAAYGVMMEGTRASPTSYTGRAGIPSFLQLARTLVLRVAAERSSATGEVSRWIVQSAERAEACYRSLVRGRCAAWGGEPRRRSTMPPIWLCHPDGLACGRLEDTRSAKRLIDSDADEMLSAHLACAAWKTPSAGAELIHAARALTAQQGLPALFVAVDEQDLPPLEQELSAVEKIVAPASIFGVGLPAGMAWTINTSEI